MSLMGSSCPTWSVTPCGYNPWASSSSLRFDEGERFEVSRTSIYSARGGGVARRCVAVDACREDYTCSFGGRQEVQT